MIDIDELVQEAHSALEAGNTLVARGYLRRATRVAPEHLDLWQDLYRVTEPGAERKRCLEHIVALDPANSKARAELRELRLQECVSPRAPKSKGEAPGIRREMADQSLDVDKPAVCAYHPGRETRLHCNLCGVPICPKCAVHTPVGFRCKACVKAQQSGFFTARWYDYPLAALLALALSIVAALIASAAGWWLVLFAGSFAGGLIGKTVRLAVGRRRGRWIWLVSGACIVLGALIALAITLQPVPIGIYAVIASGAAVGILRPRRGR